MKIICDIEGNIAIIQINNPPANELSSRVINDLCYTLDQLTGSKDTRVIIITGKGRVFCAGVDLKEIAGINSAGDSNEFRMRGRGLIKKILNLDKPLIAAINNVCLGGGLELAMACHIRLATVNARMALPEINFGILPGFGGINLLTGLVGRGRALEMILTGERMSAGDMMEVGLINHVVPGNSLITEARKIAGKISEKGLVSVSSALRMTMQECRKDFDKGLKAEAGIFDRIYETEDWKQRVSAFLDKRKNG